MGGFVIGAMAVWLLLRVLRMRCVCSTVCRCALQMFRVGVLSVCCMLCLCPACVSCVYVCAYMVCGLLCLACVCVYGVCLLCVFYVYDT